MNQIDERQLLEQAQASAEGFGALFDATYDRIYAYAYRRVHRRDAAEEIAACVFEDALRSIRRMKWDGKPAAAWLYRIASRRVADYFRHLPTGGAADLERIAVEDDSLGAIERTDQLSAVRAGLDKLAPRDRDILQLVYFDELATDQVAALFNCTANSVYVRVHRALKRLRTVLEEVQDEVPNVIMG